MSQAGWEATFTLRDLATRFEQPDSQGTEHEEGANTIEMESNSQDEKSREMPTTPLRPISPILGNGTVPENIASSVRDSTSNAQTDMSQNTANLFLDSERLLRATLHLDKPDIGGCFHPSETSNGESEARRAFSQARPCSQGPAMSQMSQGTAALVRDSESLMNKTSRFDSREPLARVSGAGTFETPRHPASAAAPLAPAPAPSQPVRTAGSEPSAAGAREEAPAPTVWDVVEDSQADDPPPPSSPAPIAAAAAVGGSASQRAPAPADDDDELTDAEMDAEDGAGAGASAGAEAQAGSGVGVEGEGGVGRAAGPGGNGVWRDVARAGDHGEATRRR